VDSKVFFMAGDASKDKSDVNYQTGSGIHTFYFRGHRIWA
jgi:hypothetical protein